MKHIKARWRLGFGLSLVVLVASGWWWQSARANMMLMMFAQEPPEGYTPLDPITHDKVRNILEDVSLDRDAMVALNPSNAQAEQLLLTVRDWQSTNQATLATLRNNIHSKVHAVRVLEKAIRVGTAGPTGREQLALAIADRTAARTAYTDALAPLKATINVALSASQQATWTAIQTGHGQQMPIRMLALTDEQRMAVSRAKRAFDRRRAGASDASGRSTAVTAWNSGLDLILTTDQKNVMAAYYQNYNGASANVASAIETVLAVETGT